MDPAKLREGLGLAPDSSDEDLKAALLAATGTTDSNTTTAPTSAPAPTTSTTSAPAAPAAEPVAAATPAPKVAGTMLVDSSAWDASQERIKRLEAEATKRQHDERDQVIAEAVKDGKFAPARTEHWRGLWDKAPDQTREVIAGLQKNVIPVDSLGFADDSDASIDDEFAGLFSPRATSKKGR